MKTMTMKKFAIPAAILLALTLTACGDADDGPAERTGERLDRTTEEAGDTLDNVQDSMSDSMERAGDSIEDAGDRIESQTD